MSFHSIVFHHAIPIERVQFGEIVGCKERSNSDPYFLGAYEWLAQEVGFWPLFLAVGPSDDVEMTGYQSNWRRFLGNDFLRRGDGTVYTRRKYVKKGESPNYVLFSFRDVAGVFTDFDAWHIALNAYGNEPPRAVTPAEHRMIFKRSWPRSRWLRLARQEPHRVQLVAPRLDLRTSCRVWVRNITTRKTLETMGFSDVHVKRIAVR